jgi:hypothetical protein
MSRCGCDDGIGLFVCRKHSTPENDVFHYVFHANREEEDTEIYSEYVEEEEDE